MQNRVLCVIPVRNGEAFIAEAIDSALAQSRPPDRIRVVDDGSNDGTARILQAYGGCIDVLRNAASQGPARSRQVAIDASSEEIIAFLDADDKWKPGHLEQLLELLCPVPEAGYAFCRIEAIGESEGYWPREPLPERVAFDFFPLLFRDSLIQTSTLVFRRDWFVRAGGFREIREFYKGRLVQAEDYDLTLRMSLLGPGLFHGEASSYYRVHGGQSRLMASRQLVNNYRYRLRLLREMRRDPARAPRITADLLRPMQQRWQMHLDGRLSCGDLEGLWWMTRFGMASPWLVRSTAVYIPHLIRLSLRALPGLRHRRTF